MLWIIIAITSFVYFFNKIRKSSYKNITEDNQKDIGKKRNKQAKTSRLETIKHLKNNKYDILVVGGGCSGAGCVLDGSTRGLNMALIESNDFASETSSKSTKLLHGGIRYLHQALTLASFNHLRLVLEALRERKIIMKMAPYLSYSVRIIMPIYTIYMIPYYWILTKLYYWLSFGYSLGSTYYLSKKNTLKNSKTLKDDNLKCSMVYYDGMMDDSRINIMLVMTACSYGAVCANHVSFVEIQDQKSYYKKVKCRDNIANEYFEIHAKIIIFCMGAFTNNICRYAIKDEDKIVAESSGTHIVLPANIWPSKYGLVGKSLFDKRTVFLLPWQDKILVGSTEVIGPIKQTKNPPKSDIEYLINFTNQFIKTRITNLNVLAAWTAFRPLLLSKSAKNTGDIAREYKISDKGDGIIYMCGGKWTTFRKSSEKTIDLAIKKYKLKAFNLCLTRHIMLLGSEKYQDDLFIRISQVLEVDLNYAKHLQKLYGSRSFMMKKYIKQFPKKISDKYLFRECEVIYCIEHEGAITSDGIVNVRFRVGFYDVNEAVKICQKVQKILKKYLKWSGNEIVWERDYTDKRLRALGYGIL